MNPGMPAADLYVADAQEAARSAGLELMILRAGADQEIDAAFETIARQRVPALAIGADPFFDTRRTKLVALAAQYAVPTMYQFREFVTSGGRAPMRPCNRCVRFATTVASGHATLATKRALLLTWAGLSPAGSHQLAAGGPLLSP